MPVYIDLFAGCGGLSLGLHNAGWRGLFAIEKSPLAFETLRYNLIENKKHFDWPTWLPESNHDINQVLKSVKELKALRGKVDLVAGGPPCQGFSTAGRREESDKRNGLIKSYIKFIRLVQPQIIFFENVRGFTQKFEKNKTKGKKYSEYVVNCLKRKGKDYPGYEVESELIDFSEYGVPQKRTRFILVGVRKDICEAGKAEEFFNLIKQNRESFLVNKGLTINTTMEEAVSDLLMANGKVACEDSKGFLAGVYVDAKTNYQRYLRNGNNTVNLHADSHRFAKHSEETTKLFNTLLKKAPRGIKIDGELKQKFNLKKRSITVLSSSHPSPTLTSHPDDYLHYCEPRILTVREYARLQSFPDWYKFRKKYTTGGKLRKHEVPRYTQLGNAIPPLFGEQVGNTLNQLITS